MPRFDAKFPNSLRLSRACGRRTYIVAGARGILMQFVAPKVGRMARRLFPPRGILISVDLLFLTWAQ